MTTPWDSETLWLKAKLFINYALDDEVERTFEERALWASLSLELLAKSALSRASPILIATPTEDGKNLLAAAGLIAGEATFKTVPAKTVFERCGHAFKPFNTRAAMRVAADRNEYLHSSTPTFTPIPADAWWPRYWALAHVLVSACDEDLDSFVGAAHVTAVEAALAKNTKNIQDRLHMLLERAKQRLARFTAGEMRGQELRDWERPTDLSARLQYSDRIACPACGATDAVVEGQAVLEVRERYEQVAEDDYEVSVEIDVEADYLSCATCHLILDGYALVEAAGVPTAFKAEGDPADFYEPDYGND